MTDDIEFGTHALSNLTVPQGHGLLLTNPPYGARVGDREKLRSLYAQLGNIARSRLPGWTVALLSAHRMLDAQVRLPFEETAHFSNGGIPVRLMRADVPA